MSLCLFADVSNLYPAVKTRYKGKVDYGKILNEFEVTRQFAYGVQVNNEATHFITALKHLNYVPKFKRLKNGETWSVEIAMDIARMMDKTQCIIVASNDLALIPAYKFAKERGIYTCVLACENREELEPHVDLYLELTEKFLEVKKEPVANEAATPAE